MGMSVKCLYCAREINPDEVVFYWENPKGDSDQIYAEFLLHVRDASGHERKGYYYTKKENADDILHEDTKNGFPISLTVRTQQGDTDDRFAATERKLTTALCPHCHCELPLETMVEDKVTQHHVLMLGGSGAGKTTYIISALHQMEKNYSDGLQLGSFTICSESRPYYDAMLESYKKAKLDATPVGEDGKIIFPMAFQIGGKTGNNQSVSSTFVILHDFPGEAMQNSDYVANLHGIEEMDTIIVMTDVHQFYNVQEESVEGTRACEDSFTNMFVNLKAKVFPGMKKVKTVVGVLLKVDLIMKDDPLGGENGYIVKGSPLFESDLTDQHRNEVDMGVMDTVSNSVDQLIQNRTESSSGLCTRLKNQFAAMKPTPETYKAFAVSTFTYNKAAGQWENDPDKAGHRALEPLIYLLAHWGVVPTQWAKAVDVDVDVDDRPWWKRLFRRS